MIKNCIVCGNERHADFMPGLKKCSDCGLVFVSVDLNDKTIRDIYGNNYFFGGVYADYMREKRALQLNFRKRLNDLLQYVETPGQKYLFEIGSAYGFFLEVAKEKFSSVRGIDISEEGCLYAREKLGMDTICDDFLKFDLEADKYDVFCLWDTIEHLRSPHSYLEKISACIKKGGVVSLTTGDIESLSARISGKRWRMIHPPEHLFYFSRDTISRLLEKSGFDVLSVKYRGNYRSLNTILAPNKSSSFLNAIDEIRPFNIPLYLNLFDIMHIVARKR
ncbi:MAG: class I SAM-dependent methyltransferase [Candidatus Omnitrophota bacterium]